MLQVPVHRVENQARSSINGRNWDSISERTLRTDYTAGNDERFKIQPAHSPSGVSKRTCAFMWNNFVCWVIHTFARSAAPKAFYINLWKNMTIISCVAHVAHSTVVPLHHHIVVVSTVIHWQYTSFDSDSIPQLFPHHTAVISTVIQWQCTSFDSYYQ